MSMRLPPWSRASAAQRLGTAAALLLAIAGGGAALEDLLVSVVDFAPHYELHGGAYANVNLNRMTNGAIETVVVDGVTASSLRLAAIAVNKVHVINCAIGTRISFSSTFTGELLNISGNTIGEEGALKESVLMPSITRAEVVYLGGNTMVDHRSTAIRFSDVLNTRRVIVFGNQMNGYNAVPQANPKAAIYFTGTLGVQSIGVISNTITGIAAVGLEVAYGAWAVDVYDNDINMHSNSVVCIELAGLALRTSHRLSITRNRISAPGAVLSLPVDIRLSTVAIADNALTDTSSVVLASIPSGAGRLATRCNTLGGGALAGASIRSSFPAGVTHSDIACGTCDYAIDCGSQTATMQQTDAGACICDCRGHGWEAGPSSVQCSGLFKENAVYVPPPEAPLPEGRGNAPFPIETFDADAEMSHCLRVGPTGDLMIEWDLNAANKTLAMRMTANHERGFSALGVYKGNQFQLMTGFPQADTSCARVLFDTYTPLSAYGDVYPNYPETPSNQVLVNVSHARHFLMRNLTSSASTLLSDGATVPTEISVLWSYQQASLFGGGCYMADVMPLTEIATISVLLGGDGYRRSASSGSCRQYAEAVTKHDFTEKINPAKPLLAGGLSQNIRVAAVMFGGDMLVQSGLTKPAFDKINGFVQVGRGTPGADLCLQSTTAVRVDWDGFSEEIGGITEYIVSVGPADKPQLYADRVSSKVTKSISLAVDMNPGDHVIATVTAFNFANAAVDAKSLSIAVLNNGQSVAGVMMDGTASQNAERRFQYQATASQLVATWTGWLPQEHSTREMGTRTYTDTGFEYAVGKAGEAPNGIRDWQSVAAFATSVTISGLALEEAAEYTVAVRADNCAGAVTQQSTPGVRVDTQPPHAGSVIVGNYSFPEHRAEIGLTEPLEIRWTGFVDAVSGVGSYEWAVSKASAPGSLTSSAGLVIPWTPVGLARRASTSDTIGTFDVARGEAIYAFVKALDVAGNMIHATSPVSLII